MTEERAKIAFWLGEAVIYDGIRYPRIEELIIKRRGRRSLADRLTRDTDKYYCFVVNDHGCRVVCSAEALTETCTEPEEMFKKQILLNFAGV